MFELSRLQLEGLTSNAFNSVSHRGWSGGMLPGKFLNLSPLKWLEINIKNQNGVVKLGILSTSRNVAIKKKTVSTKRMIQQQLFSQPSTFFDKKIIAFIVATFAVAKRKPEKNSGLYGIRTLDLCHTIFFLKVFLEWEKRSLCRVDDVIMIAFFPRNIL